MLSQNLSFATVDMPRKNDRIVHENFWGEGRISRLEKLYMSIDID